MSEKQTKTYIGLSDRIRMQKDSQEALLEGSSWMTIGNMVSRLLGALYIIPWGAMLGAQRDDANFLYFIAYNIYALVLQISTAGIPTAISKMVADNQSRKDYATSWKIFKGGMVFMMLTGLIAAIIMYVTAPFFAKGGSPEEFEASIMVIRSLVPAVLIIPPLSLMRGYYQGYSDMAPSAKSQLWEQVVRIVYMLALTFIIMRVLGGNYATAVAHSTFAAFVGAVVAFAYLAYKMWRDFPGMQGLMTEGRPARKMSFGRIVFDVIREAIPFIVVSSGIQVISLIDQETFQPLTAWLTTLSFDQSKELLTILGFNTNKIIMIIVSLSVSMASAALPLLATTHSKGDHSGIQKIVEENIELFAFIMFPAAVGMAVVGEPIYNVFYSPNPIGTYLMVISCIMCLFMGSYTVLSSIHQAMQQHRVAMRGLGIALVFKMLWQPMLVYFFLGAGPLLATSMGFLLATLYMTYELYRQTHFDIRRVGVNMAKIIGMSAVMSIVTMATLLGIKQVMSVDGKLTAFIAVAVVALVGIVVYVFLSLQTRLADKVLGEERIAGLRRRLGMKG